MKRSFLLFTFLFLSALGFAQTPFSVQLSPNINIESSGNCLSNINFLQALPEGKMYKYKWIRNNVLLEENNSSTLKIDKEGIYKVVISDSTFNFKSEELLVYSCAEVIEPIIDKKTTSNSSLISTPTITVDNPVVCGSNTSATLTSSPQGAGYTYQWYSSSNQYGTYSVVSGATNPTLITSTAAWYKVFINDGVSIPALSSQIQISNSPQGFISDMNGNAFSTINTTAGTPTQVKFNFVGNEPVTFQVFDRTSNKTYTTGTTSPYIFTIKANQNTQFQASGIANSCGTNNSLYSYVRLQIDGSTSFSLLNPAATNVCAGSTIDIPYAIAGTWDTPRSLYVSLIDQANTNAFVASSGNNYTNPIRFTLPSSLPLNSTYKVYVSSSLPITNPYSVTSSYTLTVTSTGCSALPVVYVSPSNVSCGSVYLNTSSVSGATYKWYKDNVLVSTSGGNGYTALTSGTYKVQVINTSTGYDQTSADFPVTVLGSNPVITSINPVLCGSTTSATLSVSAPSSASYQWLSSISEYGTYLPIDGATNASYSATYIGYYKVKVDDGECQNTSTDPINVSSNPQYKISGINGETGTISINAGQTAQIKLQFYGSTPYIFTYSDNNGVGKTISTSTNPYIINVQPSRNTRYYIALASNECGLATTNSSSINVDVLPAPNFIFGTPSTTTTCVGGRFEIPYTISGTWGSGQHTSEIQLLDNNGNYVNNSFFSDYGYLSPLFYEVPTSLSPGTYKLRVRFYAPDISTAFVSNYDITVNSAGCAIPSARIATRLNECSDSNLRAYPSGSGFSYAWYKDGVVVSGATDSYFYPNSNGNYSVQITNTSSAYTSTSPVISFTTTNAPFSNTLNKWNCVVGSVIAAPKQDASFTYQWYYSPTTFGHTPIAGATNSTYTTTQGGSYLLITKNGTCEGTATFNCPILVDFVNKTVCQQSGVSVPFYISGIYSLKTYKLQLTNTSGVVIIDSLSTLTTNNGNETFNFVLPATVTAGTYKFKVVTTDNSYASTISNGVLTVTSNVSAVGPTLTATPAIIVGTGQNVNISVTNCAGTAYWDDGYSGLIRNLYMNYPNTYTVYCMDGNGCNSQPSAISIISNCTDAYEPNNSAQTAAPALGNSFNSSVMCFNVGTDADWFYFIYNGKKYHIRAGSFGEANRTGSYVLSKTIVGNTLTLQTTSPTNSYFDTVLSLLDSDGSTELAYNDDGNGNGLSIITYTLTNPCQNNVVLTSTVFDVPTGEGSIVKANNITGSNKLENTSIVNYRAEQFVTLLPGFETKISTQGSFKAEIKNCNDL